MDERSPLIATSRTHAAALTDLFITFFALGSPVGAARITPALSGGGKSTPDLRLHHRAAQLLCPPVRFSAWLDFVELNQISLNIQRTVEHPEDIDLLL